MYKVYIDAGHGGVDSGAVGNSLLEKNINLSVALKVKDLLLKQKDFSVRLSRVSDKALSLSERVRDSNNWGSDCFVSIHCNSSDKISANGIETFCTKEGTSNLASKVHDSLLNDKSLYSIDRGVKYANFSVIANTNARACLVEMAFISNKLDALILKNEQDAFALQITKGICKHFGVNYNGQVVAAKFEIGNYGKDVKVTTTLNVRLGRGTSFEKIGQLKLGDVVNVWYIDKDKDNRLWGSIGFNGQTAYICMDYVDQL